MNINKHYDIIIAGAGAFGCSLLWYLLESDALKAKKILLLDRNLKPDHSKTWCFWDDDTFRITESIYHTWQDIRVNTRHEQINESLQKYRYHCVRSHDFSEKILDTASGFENITLLEAELIDFESINDAATVLTSAGNFTSEIIFQSALKPKDYNHQKSDISLNQHFLGWEIEVNNPLFNPKEALLMDFNVTQKYGFAFIYLLPYSTKRALVEFTLFSEQLLTKDQYESEIETYLNRNFNLEKRYFRINRKEFGNIPMEDRTFSSTYCKNVYNCGTVGGHTKPSTGYTFRRIQKQCMEIVSALESGRPIPEQQASSYRFRVYDMMLLYNLKNDPQGSLQIFHDLFKKNRFDSVFKFLDEKTSIPEELSIFTSFAPGPFIKSIYRMKHRIFTGA